VKNLKRTSKNTRPLGYLSWLDYWYKKSHSMRIWCARSGCSNECKHGAHVKIVDKRCNKDWYIVPLCESCNNPKHIYGFFHQIKC